jgi:hypothetical protein
MAVPGSPVALPGHQLVIASGWIGLSGKHQPVVGGQNDLGGGAHGAALGEPAADGQVQVAAVLSQGAGETISNVPCQVAWLMPPRAAP